MSALFSQIPPAWRPYLSATAQQNLAKLEAILVQEQKQSQVYPPTQQIFQALELCSPTEVKVVILGQDPYHGVGQAHGLAFSVQPETKPPPSLKNIYKELAADLGCEIPEHGYLVDWARQGVLLLNAVLTVRAQSAASHQKLGWQSITDSLISSLSAQADHLVFVLWGNFAQKKAALIADKHSLIQSVHPSPLSAHRGFLGSKPFSQINQALVKHQQTPINWCLKDLKEV